MPRRPSILLLSDHAERKRQWAEMLESADASIWTDSADLDDRTTLDVIVTDARVLQQLERGQQKHLARGEIGVVAAGSGGPADVSLPPNFTRRELRLACLLLAEIVRLRRERHQHQRHGRVLAQMALSDPLTGLRNRRAWEDELLARGSDKVCPTGMCIALVDLDQFKRVNDQFGHSAGDDVLRQVGRQLAEATRQTDFVARLGGDEFAVLLSELDEHSSWDVVDRIRIAAGLHCSLGGGLDIRASAGLSIARTDGTSMVELFEQADSALRLAKQAGRDQTVQHTS